MCHLISSEYKSFQTPRTLCIAGNQYHDIASSSFKDFVDADEKRKQVYYLRAKDSEHAVFVENNRVARSEELFDYPRTMKFGEKVYPDITAKIKLADKNYDTYISESLYGDFRELRVRHKTGSVLDVTDLRARVLQRKIGGAVKKLAQILH